MWNNRPVGQLWRALMCETPIKRFAGMATKHFIFKYGSQFVLHNSINITKVGWRMRSGNQPIRRKPTQTHQRRQHFAQAFVLITSCWQKLIKKQKRSWNRVVDILYTLVVIVVIKHTVCLKQPSCDVPWCALPLLDRDHLVLVCFTGAVTARRRVHRRRAPVPSVAVFSWHRSEGRTP